MNNVGPFAERQQRSDDLVCMVTSFPLLIQRRPEMPLFYPLIRKMFLLFLSFSSTSMLSKVWRSSYKRCAGSMILRTIFESQVHSCVNA